MLKPGDKVPDFTLPLATAEAKSKFRFHDALGKGDVVIAFYPLAFTSTCTAEMCETRDSMKFWEHVNATPFGFSTDTVFANYAYAREHALNFGLLSDANHEVVDALWETQTVAGVKNCAKRGVMIVGPDGVVKYVKVIENPGEWMGYEEVKHLLHGGHKH